MPVVFYISFLDVIIKYFFCYIMIGGYDEFNRFYNNRSTTFTLFCHTKTYIKYEIYCIFSQ